MTPVLSTIIVAGPSTFLIIRPALIPATRNAPVSNEAISMCVNRYGNDGLKMICHQSTA